MIAPCCSLRLNEVNLLDVVWPVVCEADAQPDVFKQTLSWQEPCGEPHSWPLHVSLLFAAAWHKSLDTEVPIDWPANRSHEDERPSLSTSSPELHSPGSMSHTPLIVGF